MDENIAKLNIAHLRQMLTEVGLAFDKRGAIEQLLSREEQTLSRLMRRSRKKTTDGVVGLNT